MKYKYAGRYKKDGVIRYKGEEPENIKAERIIKQSFEETRLKFAPICEV